MESKTYYLGLDIGTNSIGWAVTDPAYNVIKKNGKALWGIRLFDEAQTAAERRTHRSARRRLVRRNERIKLLQELFAEEISKADMGFYQRLKESSLYIEDRSENNRQINTLFCDKDFTDRQYYDLYPTIYHLRKELAESTEPHDIRLLYLAVHHILKNRGHFLFEGRKLNEILEIETAFETFCNALLEEFDIDWSRTDLEALKAILMEKADGKTQRNAKLQSLFAVDKKDKRQVAIIKLLSGSTGVKLSDLFDAEELAEYEHNKIGFSLTGIEDVLTQIEADYPEYIYVLHAIKVLYDWALLTEVLSGHKNLSSAKVEIYEKHKSDLKRLKSFVKKYCKGQYDKLFRSAEEKDNYCAYVGRCSVNGKNDRNQWVIKERCSQEVFYKALKKMIESAATDDEEKIKILNDIDRGKFLPLQVTKDNGVIPYQVHKTELEQILRNASLYLPFLKEKDETDLSVIDKICGCNEKMGLINYRIPYYVGPLNTAHAEDGFAWVSRLRSGKVYPWNFEEMVDVEKSAERFIKRMTNKCTYLWGEDVLPKDSLLYSKYMVLNEINLITIGGERLPVELKQKLYTDLFQKQKKVRRKDLENFLTAEGFGNAIKEAGIGGFDGDFKSSLTSYIDWRKVCEEGEIRQRDFEKIIETIVLFGDDRKMLQKCLKREFPYLKESQIKSCAKLKYKEWGRLSKKLLEEITIPDAYTGEIINIIRHMWETNDNLMQTLRAELGFKEQIDEFNRKDQSAGRISYKDVDELYVSPAVKRPIWQTMQIVEELQKALGGAPKKVFVEVTRKEEKDKKRKESRKQQLLDLYKQCRGEEKDFWIRDIESRNENYFRRNSLYLYYTQMGRDMYTGKPIDLDALMSGHTYDKDHIYPRSKTKDDSMDNLVLVNKTDNAKKSDEYPLPEEIRNKQQPFWSQLYKQGLISKKKYERLIRKTPFDDNELADFINRQMVETSQSNKAVAELLQKYFPDAEIVYSKAHNVSEFRQANNFIKVREVNDLHHAKDAYLNIVVGNVYHTKFTKNPIRYIKDSSYRSYSLNRMYDFEVQRNGETAWVPGKEGSIATVIRWMKKNNILFTRYAYEAKGGFFDQNLMKKGNGQLEIKNNKEQYLDINKYGGYNKVSGAYYFLVAHEEKGKRIKTIEMVPVHLSKQIQSGRLSLMDYCQKEEYLNLKNPKILVEKIKINALFEKDGFRMHLSGRTGNRLIFKGAKQFILLGDLEQRAKQASGDKCFGVTEAEARKQNFEIYKQIENALECLRYSVPLSAQLKTLKNGEEKFFALTMTEQHKVLMELLKLLQCNAVLADLSLIGGAGHAGTILNNKNITKEQSLFLINQSVTGLFEQKINLATL